MNYLHKLIKFDFLDPFIFLLFPYTVDNLFELFFKIREQLN